MFSKKAYNQGVENAARAHEEKYKTINEQRRRDERRQEEINEQNRRLQREMIDNMEKHDNEIDQLFNLVGAKRSCGESGEAVFDQEKNGVPMTEYADNLMDRYNLLNFQKGFRSDPEVVENVAVILTEVVETGMNTKFHRSLNILEKCGIMEREKYERHIRNVELGKAVTAMSVYTAFSLAPAVYESVNQYFRKKDFENFIVGSFGYINKGQSTNMIRNQIVRLLEQSGIKKVNLKQVDQLLEKYSTDNALRKLPSLSNKTAGLYGIDGLIDIGKQVISRCDLNDKATHDRAMEYICDFLRVPYNQAEGVLLSVSESQDSLSDIALFAGINFEYYFQDFFKNISEAKKFAYYNLDNDPYKSLRDDRRSTMQDIVDKVSSSKNPFLTKGKRKDIIMAATDVVRCAVDYNVSQDLKMLQRRHEVMNYYD